ncbi:cytochrome P450 2J2-like [Acipenser oxyrinchus oxyrinchus]|uniref:Cytochrome P450 2J2-like n=1 Tax=Acipenser oxyrinchus oxyrinchus TaxID=40147 RepID=A0AAD8D6T0_ACIOX|nr:cytochrome P450 2J2-like [Acipenser oxyrinchus oxyrinchus]
MAFLQRCIHVFWEWMDVRSVLIFFLVFLLIADLFKHRVPKNFPPGPRGLPFLGNLLNLYVKQPHLSISMLAEKYGDVFSIRLGTNTVVINGYKLVKEALVHQADTFADRPRVPLAENFRKNSGLILSNGHVWKQQRRFALTTLKNFGVGKKTLESTVLEEVRYLHEAFEEEQGQPFDPDFTIHNAVSNIICSLVFGDRFEYSDTRFQELLRLFEDVFNLQGSFWGQLQTALPAIMNRVPGPHQKIVVLWEALIDFVKSEIKRHKEDWDPSAPRDYIDCYLGEIEKCKEDLAGGFNEENLIFCTLDLFIAGTASTSTTLRWALLYIMKYPEIQEKIQAEIDSMIGQARQPSMEDKPNMPYTEAVIHEVQRMGNVAPLNVPRMTTEDTTLGGYFIPKGTQVFATLSSVLFDKNEWQTPDTFNPGHFLDAEGQFVRRDAFLPFSAGKRVCLGEQLARMELFLFLTSFLQKFTISSPKGVEPSLQYQVGVGFGISPRPYKICLVPR